MNMSQFAERGVMQRGWLRRALAAALPGYAGRDDDGPAIVQAMEAELERNPAFRETVNRIYGEMPQ